MKMTKHAEAILFIFTTAVSGLAIADCPNKLPVQLLEDCLVYEGAGYSFPPDDYVNMDMYQNWVATQQITWQQRRLNYPTIEELQWERNNHVMIYEGMTDKEVEHAVDKDFNRVQSMMFVNTVVTDHDGLPLEDPETGKAVTEDDGCN